MEAGLLAPPGDPDALAAAVLRLLEAPEYARQLAAAGRQLVRQRYTLEGQAPALASLYRKALS
jgi:glycosyltransferase involved in cell wall biosynthesis